MTGLVAFLLARLDDDERIARAIESTKWCQGVPNGDEVPNHVYVFDQDPPWSGIRTFHDLTEEEAAHIARWNPVRVLADIAAKRRIIEWQTYMADEIENDNARAAWESIVRLLASVWSDHPDYDHNWA